MGIGGLLHALGRVAIGWTQIRPGPEPGRAVWPADADRRCGQADLQRIVQPSAANKGLFFLAPVMTIMPALVAGGAVRPWVAVSNVNAGLLLLMTITSIEVYGIIIAGWASNSKYAFLGRCVPRRRW